MQIIAESIQANPETLVLIFLRISAYVFISPLFGRNTTPQMFKAGFSMFIGYLIFVTYDFEVVSQDYELIQFVLICVKEVIIGLIIGFLSSLFFSIFTVAGKFIDSQVSFDLAGMVDPLMNFKMPLTGNLLTTLIFLIFLELNGHLILINILYNSYELVPLGEGTFTTDIVGTVLSAFYLSFVYATKIAIPIIVLMLVVEFVLGIIVKFVPQMNVFVVGIPLRIFIGLVTIYYIIAPVSFLADKIFEDMYEYTTKTIYNMIG